MTVGLWKLLFEDVSEARGITVETVASKRGCPSNLLCDVMFSVPWTPNKQRQSRDKTE
jgi:hypothetical protein